MRTFVPACPETTIYLRPLASLVEGKLKLFVDDMKVDRLGQDGIITAIGKISDLDVGIIYQDFRVNGASISKENAQRMIAFMELLQEMNLPLVFLMNSLGVRITQGRTIFDDAFSVIPSLFKLKKNVPVITAAIGNTIGISAIYFAQGHYRMATAESALNLAGPEVHRRFFGDKNLSFQKFAPAAHQVRINSLVHDVTMSVNELYEKIKNVTRMLSDTISQPAVFPESYNSALKELLTSLAPDVQELFPLRGQDVKIFIGKIGLQKIGFILNPPGRPNNLLTVASIDKTMAAMDLFKVLKLPVVSIIDCPGGDPRQGESDADGLSKMTELVRVMIEYPFKKMGIVNGRCFGGSGMFIFPKIFGGQRNLVVEGSQLGIMNESIIKELLSNSPRLLKEWQVMHESETADLQDMKKAGTLDRIITKEDISHEIRLFAINHQIDQEMTEIRQNTNNLIVLQS